ncbi:hypothetical protein NC652_024103 [Populus alba x Populus x berolinensis]|nr:hypothetical protein NC652_024103 [Populus alba x Populus x berolinensis]
MGIYASHLPKETPFQAPLLELRHGKVACAFTGLCCALIRRALSQDLCPLMYERRISGMEQQEEVSVLICICWIREH